MIYIFFVAEKQFDKISKLAADFQLPRRQKPISLNDIMRSFIPIYSSNNLGTKFHLSHIILINFNV